MGMTLTAEQEAARREMIAQGLSWREIGRCCSPPVSGQAVHRWAMRMGLTKRPAPSRRPGESIQARCYHLGIVEGRPWAEVGAELGLSNAVAATRAWIHKDLHGLPWRYRCKSGGQRLPPLPEPPASTDPRSGS
jgi:hypothetical protein